MKSNSWSYKCMIENKTWEWVKLIKKIAWILHVSEICMIQYED